MRDKRIAVLVSFCIFLISYGLLNAHEAKAKPPDTLVVASGETMHTFDHYYNNRRDGLNAAHQIFDYPLYRDPKTMKIVPGLCESWRYIDDKTLELRIRKGVKFTNGEPVNAEAFKFTFEFMIHPESKIVTRQNVAWLDKVRIVDDLTVRLIMKAPYAPALQQLANSMPVYPPKYFKEVGRDQFGMKPVGSGPYKLVSWKRGAEYVLEANPDYFDRGKNKPKIKKVIVREIPELATQINELISGGIDLIQLLPSDQAETIKKNKHLKLQTTPILRIWFVQMDGQGRSSPNTPFAKLKVRQAVNHAIDRQGIVDNILGGFGKVITSACNPLHFGCETNVKTYPYDPKLAKKLLAEAGYPNGFSTDFYGYRDKQTVEAVMGYLEAVGIKATLKWFGGQYATFDKYQRVQGIAPIAVNAWGSYSVFDCSSCTSTWFANKGGYNYNERPELMAWLKEADGIVDEAKRKELYSKALKYIAENAFWVPLYSGVMINAMDSRLDYEVAADENARYFTASWK